MPEAKSAVSFALSLDPEGIRAMLAKESNSGYTKNYIGGEISATEAELTAKLQAATDKQRKWSQRTDVDPSLKTLTCSNCQIICGTDKEQRKESYRVLKNSGCIIQRENGDIVVLPPDEAAEAFDKMDPVHKALYTDVDL